LELPRKHPTGDSDSSSDETLFSSVFLPEPLEQRWTFKKCTPLLTSQVSCTSTSVSDASNRSKKRRHSSSGHISASDEPSTSTHPFITSKSAESFKSESFVSVGSTSSSMNDRNSNCQDGDSVCQKVKTVTGSSSASVEEVNSGQKSNVPKANESEQERSLRADFISCGPFDFGARRRFRRLARCCSYTGPHLFRLPHHEPTNESTISDLCIMSFVLKDSETDGAGYVRIISPQLVSARPQLHTLVVKNYKMITDASLTYLLKLNSLRYLDVSGTSVSEVGVLQFKLKRPDVEVISDYKGLPI
jgi:hypothetical protein